MIIPKKLLSSSTRAEIVNNIHYYRHSALTFFWTMRELQLCSYISYAAAHNQVENRVFYYLKNSAIIKR